MGTLYIDRTLERPHSSTQSASPELRMISGVSGVGAFDRDPTGILDELASRSEALLREAGDFLLRCAARMSDPELLKFLLDYRFDDVPAGESPRRLDALKGLRLMTLDADETAPTKPWQRMPQGFAKKLCVADLSSSVGDAVACLDVLVEHSGPEQLRVRVKSLVTAAHGSEHSPLGHQTLLMLALAQGRHAFAARILTLAPESLLDRTSMGHTIDDVIDRTPSFNRSSVALVRAAQASRLAHDLVASTASTAAAPNAAQGLHR